MFRKLISRWRMAVDSRDEITVLTTDLDQAERDYIESVKSMPGGNSGIADFY